MSGMAELAEKGDVMIRQAVIIAGLVCLVLLLAACGTVAQNTAKDDHLGRYAARAAVAKGQPIDPAVRQAILTEPALRFPARIGLVRLETGTVSPIPQDEAEAWLVMVRELGPGWGELVPISPIEVALVDPDGGGPADCRGGVEWSASPCDPADIATTLRNIRRSAERQQLDAVLIYEVLDGSRQSLDRPAATKLAPVDDLLTLIAAVGASSQAQGILMDAHQGAIYGFATGGAEAADFSIRDQAGTAVMDLAKETGTMLRELRIELAEARAARAEAGNQSGFRPN